MLTQKLYKNGNSVAVTIPKEYLEDLNLKEGSQVVLNREGNEIIIASKQQDLAPDVNAKFMQMVDEFIADHEDVLKELAGK